MNYFSCRWVILRVAVFQDGLLLFDVFTQEYGLLKLKAKRTKQKKSLDIGYSIAFEVQVKKENDIHEIKNIKTRGEFAYIGQPYDAIMTYLELVGTVLKVPRNIQIQEIYHILHAVSTSELATAYILFAHVKILCIMGITLLSREVQIQKIFKFIGENSFPRICKLTGSTTELEENIRKIICEEKKRNPNLRAL